MIEEVTQCPICSGSHFDNFLKCLDHSISNEWFNIKTCKDCNLLLTSPRPTSDSIVTYYESEDYISHANKANSLAGRLYMFVRKFTLQWKLDIINQHATNTKRLLDYGCGTGDFLKTCADNGWQIAGVEPSIQALSIAREKTRSTNLFDNILQTEGTFDAITLWHVLEHVPDLKMTVEILKNKLDANGTIFIAVPNHASWDASYYNQYWAGYDVPRHLWHFSKGNMKQLIENAGLRLINILPMRLDAFYISLLSERYKAGGKSSIAQMIKAFINGLRSNIKAQKTQQYSSLIYIIKK